MTMRFLQRKMAEYENLREENEAQQCDETAIPVGQNSI